MQSRKNAKCKSGTTFRTCKAMPLIGAPAMQSRLGACSPSGQSALVKLLQPQAHRCCNKEMTAQSAHSPLLQSMSRPTWIAMRDRQLIQLCCVLTGIGLQVHPRPLSSDFEPTLASQTCNHKTAVSQYHCFPNFSQVCASSPKLPSSDQPWP